MAGRGREATLPAWQTQTAGLGGFPGQQGPSGRVGGPPGALMGQNGWPPQQGGAPSRGLPAQGQPWGPPVQGVQRPPFGNVPPNMPPQGFQGQARPMGLPPGGHLPSRPDMFPAGSQQGYPMHGSGGRPMGSLSQPPVMVQRPPQHFPGHPQMGAPGAAQTSPLVASPAVRASPRQPASSVWTEHTAPDGRKYYHNTVTKTSSWTKPAELGQARSETPGKQEVQCDWKEFTAPDGRKYYYNRVTKQSKWQIPEELKQAQAMVSVSKGASKPSSVQILKLQEPSGSSASPALGAANGLSGTPTSVTDDIKLGLKAEEDANSGLPEPKRPVVYATKEEAKHAFKELLVSVGTTSTSTWEATMRLIVNDPRYEAFRTIGEKKACFNEYLQQRAKEEKEELRMRSKQARDDFMTLLELSPELRAGTRYSKAAILFEDEPRWKAIKDSREREQLFNDHMKERDRKEKEQRRAEVKKRKAAFRALLEATKSIKVDSPWRKVQGRLEGEDEYESVEKLDRLEVFQEYIWDLEKKEKSRREKEKEQKQRQERQNRDTFKGLLRQHKEDGTICAKMRWKDYHKLVVDEVALKAIEQNMYGSRPRELFEDVLEEVEEDFMKTRSHLRDAKVMEILADTSFNDYNAALESLEDARTVPEHHKKLMFEEEKGRIMDKVAKEEKRKRRAKEDFQHLLRDTRRINHDTSWQEAKSLLEKEPEYKALDSMERESLYNEYIEKLKARREKEKEREKEDKKSKRADDDDKPRKDKKRHKKEKHSDKDRSADKKSRDKERHAKRRHDESDVDEDKKSSKRHKRSKDKEEDQAADTGTGSPGSPADVKSGADRAPETSPGARRKKAGSRGSDAEEGEL